MTQADPKTKNFITAGAHRICYVEGGDRSLPPAIFLHGWIASHQLYRKVFQELGQLFHFYAVDLVGFGDSDKPSPDAFAYDAAAYADSVAAFADAVGLKDKFTLMAQSMGGIVGAEFAARFPDRLSRLILIDSAGVAVKAPLLGQILQLPVVGRPLFMALGGTRKAVSDFLRNDVYFVKESFQDVVVDDMLRVIGQPGGKAAAYATLTRILAPEKAAAFTPRFADIRVPTALIWGEHDKLFPVERCAREVERRIPGAKLFVVPGSGHEPPVEQPAAFLQSLRQALT